ncbi:alpha-glucosidase [Kwoniella heveanensis CBS 569]|nr:alpha-glucosidase [Kwoniella heveanensis CBS 569]
MLQRNPDADWWRQAVIYQIYPRSFADANNDGLGDLKGVTSRVDYLASLGVDAVWLSPFYPSALKDGGYDVADYRNVDPRLGTMDDFDEMLEALSEVNIKVMVDIVPNHCSDDHPWFQKALKAGKGSKEREKFIFRDGLGPDKSEPPTDWQCAFGGSAWSPSGFNDGQFYYHMFDSSQPDWNWDNTEVRDDFLYTLKFWADRGVAGFRIDVAHALVKDMSEPLPDWEELKEKTRLKLTNGYSHLVHPYMDRDEVQDVYRDWRKLFNQYEPPLFAVAECWVAPDRKPLYASSEGLGQAFSFDMMLCNFDAGEFRTCIKKSIEDCEKAGSSNTWVLSNHDEIRHVTRYALPNVANANYTEFDDAFNAYKRSQFLEPPLDLEQGLKRARAATLMMLGLPGSTYIYQGEELGLPEVIEIPGSERQDPHFHRTKGHCPGRDGCRVPLPWSASPEANFGFSSDTFTARPTNGNSNANGHMRLTGPKAHLPQPDWMSKFSVESEELQPESSLNFYRRALKMRKQLLPNVEQLEWVEHSATGAVNEIGNGVGLQDGILHFRRPGGWEIILNANAQACHVNLPKGKIVISSSQDACKEVVGEALGGGVLVPGETTIWLKAN